MKALAVLLLVVAAPAAADDAAVRRAIIERDQQSAEFAAGVRRSQLEPLHQRQLLDALTLPSQPAGYQRARMAQEREAFLLQLSPPVIRPGRSDAPLPLPGGPAHGVDPIPLQGLGG